MSTSSKKLVEFLFLETITTLEQSGWYDFIKSYYKNSILPQQIVDLLYILADFHSFIFQKKVCKDLRKHLDTPKTLLFQDTHLFKDIIKFIGTYRNKRFQILLWTNIKDFLFSMNHSHKKFKIRKIWIPPISLKYNGILYFKKNFKKYYNISFIEKIKRKINKLEQIISRYSPNAIILRTDSFPIDRAIILIARELNIPTINVQDGIYQSMYPLVHGRAADYVFVLGEYFKHLYLKQKIRSSKTIKILGYPYELQPLPQNTKKQKLTVYYLGQNFEAYNKELLKTKIKTVNTLNKICKKYGFEFIYRPHPGDSRKFLQKKLPNVNFAPKNETLWGSFKRGDIFISFNSTALIEAALHGKLCIQLKSYPLPTDDFEKLGICPKSFDTLEDLEEYLKEIAKAEDLKQFYKPVNPKYIEIPKPDPGEKFLELVQDII